MSVAVGVPPCQPAPAPLDDAAKRRGLPWQLASGAANSAFCSLTFFGSVFLLFLSELGLPKVQIGLLLALLPFCGLLALGFAPLATRLGRKRVFLGCFAARKVVTAGLLLLPWVIGAAGQRAGLAWVGGIVAVFAVLRALGETAYYPWSQECIPNAVRGRFGALNSVLTTLGSCAALWLAGQVIRHGHGLERFLQLIAVGCLFGLLSVALMLPVPGGRPEPPAPDGETHLANLREALRDRNLVLYLLGLGGVTIGPLLYLSFLPLFVKERLGVTPQAVVTLEAAAMIGGAVSAPLWGWAADRVGSRPPLTCALAAALLMPLAWLLLPRLLAQPLPWCAALYLANGVVGCGLNLGTVRLLFNSVVPPERSTAYTAVYYAWLGLTGGAAPLLAGALLDGCGTRAWQYGAVLVDGHTVLFALALVLVGAAMVCFAQARPDGHYRTRDVVRRLAAKLRAC